MQFHYVSILAQIIQLILEKCILNLSTRKCGKLYILDISCVSFDVKFMHNQAAEQAEVSASEFGCRL